MVERVGVWMRQWLVFLLTTLAIAGMAFPVLASQPDFAIPIPSDFGRGIEDSSPENGDDDNSEAGNGDGDDVDEEDEDEADDDEDEFEEEEREVKVEIDDDVVTIELESKSEEREDEVKVQFDAAEAQMKVSFEMEAIQEEEVEMRIDFRELVEFEDDGDGAFSPLEDEVLQSIDVETLALRGAPEANPFTMGSSSGQRINVTYALPGSSDGSLELVFWVFGLVTEIDGVPVRPTETKIDINVTDFPFGPTTSRLALGLDVKTEFELEMDPGLTFDQITATGEEFAAFFQWMPDAVTVDGSSASAAITTVREQREVELEGDEGEFEKKIRLFLAYPQGAEIVHDPKVGIMAVSASVLPVALPRLAVYAVGLATALLLVIGVWALNRRRT